MKRKSTIRVEHLRAGRDLDALVSEQILGSEVCRCKFCRDTGPNGACESCGMPKGRYYSTQPERALGLLERLASRNRVAYRIERKSDRAGKPLFEITLRKDGKRRIAQAKGPTLALAACRAALLAI